MSTDQLQSLVNAVAAQPGEPLPPRWRAVLEARTGTDLRHVRIHRGGQAARAARALQARAYAFRNGIVFDEGEFQPDSRRGLRLLAHEIAHVAQPLLGAGTGALVLPGPDAPWEAAADAFAEAVLAGRPAPPPVRHPSPDALLRHASDPAPCPQLPEWEPIGAGPQALWLGANLAIEAAYRASHGGQVFLMGSDLARESKNVDIALSREQIAILRKKSGEAGVKEASYILSQLRGIQRQRQPDIIDFSGRAFYEIKPIGSIQRNLGAAVEQLESYYAVTDALTTNAGTTPWNRDGPSWYPMHVLILPGDSDKRVCTAQTQYVAGERRTARRPGLIIYEIYQRVSDEERRRRAAAMQVMVIPEIQSLQGVITSEFRKAVTSAYEREYVIFCTQEFRDGVVQPIMQRAMMERIRPMQIDPRSDLLMGIRTYSAFAYLLAGVSFIVNCASILALEALVATEAAVAVADVAVPVVRGMQLTMLAARTAANDNAVRVGSMAAAALMYVFVSRDASARTIDKVGGLFALPRSKITLPEQLESLSEIQLEGRKVFFVGRAAPPDSP